MNEGGRSNIQRGLRLCNHVRVIRLQSLIVLILYWTKCNEILGHVTEYQSHQGLGSKIRWCGSQNWRITCEAPAATANVMPIKFNIISRRVEYLSWCGWTIVLSQKAERSNRNSDKNDAGPSVSAAFAFSTSLSDIFLDAFFGQRREARMPFGFSFMSRVTCSEGVSSFEKAVLISSAVCGRLPDVCRVGSVPMFECCTLCGLTSVRNLWVYISGSMRFRGPRHPTAPMTPSRESNSAY